MRRVAITIAFWLLAFSASAADLQSISRLAVGPSNVLFLTDWKAARVHAITMPPAPAKPAGTAFNILDLEQLLSKQVGGAKVVVEDMVARPGTGEVYLSISYGARKAPALFVLSGDGKARRLNLNTMPSTSVALRDAPKNDQTFWKETPERSFTVTDMKWHDGELYIAGLSNQNFASTLRRVKYPFGADPAVTSVEIYHAGHNLIETRAPIRAMSFASWGGKSYLVAAYTCTPLVILPLDSLKDGAHIRGKTVAELGYGNTPADMITYTTTTQGKTEEFVLLVNFERGPNLIPMSQLQAAEARPGIESRVSFGETAGLAPSQIPLAGTLRVDNLDEESFVMVRRELQKDKLQLVSIAKDLSFRLTDHISEYSFSDYSFKGDDFQLRNIKPRQDILLRKEGFPDLIKSVE